MKLKLIAICLILPCASIASARTMMVVGGGVPAAPASTTPDVYYQCEDNAASTAVVATYGTNGVIVGSSTSNNTANNTTTTHFAGERAIQLNDDTARIIGKVTEASVEDGVCTFQFAYLAGTVTTGFGAGNYVRLMAEESGSSFQFKSDNGSSTAFLANVEGTEYSVTLDDINDGNWHVVRIVLDTGAASDKLRVYQGSSESTLTLKYESNAAAVSNMSFDSVDLYFGGNGDANKGIQLRNGILDEIKIWYTAEIPS